ncbi:MAG: GntR family transcriptional regulator [Planctomycetes bacterium]|nr:GntR family transcriptional regulator [Planctomycetota bacterium]
MNTPRQPLARRIAEELRERFLKAARPGRRLPSVSALATELGVSVLTLRAAQAILAREGLLDIQHGSGVYLAEPPKPRWVGICTAFNILQPRVSAFHIRMPYELSRFLEQNGFRTELYIGGPLMREHDPPSACGRLVADVESGRLEGLAILTAPPTAVWKEWVAGLRIPAVGDHTPYTAGAGYADLVHRAVRLLKARDCRRIAMLAWAHDGLRGPLQEALADCDLQYRPEWVRSDLHPMLSAAGWEEFREVWFAHREKPDGLLVLDDVLFEEARIAIVELGIRVPDRLRIVAHTCAGTDRGYPFPVTEARSDPKRHAEALGAMLLTRLRGGAVEPPGVSIPIELADTQPAAAPAVLHVVPHATEHVNTARG